MNCGQVQKKIDRWIDSRLGEAEADMLSKHLEGCPACAGEAESARVLKEFLVEGRPAPDLSPGFDAAFWGKIAARERRPRLRMLLDVFEDLVPFPSVPQLAGVLVAALFVGATGGAVSAGIAPFPIESKKSAVLYLSGFPHFKGVPQPSLAGTYIEAVSGENPS